MFKYKIRLDTLGDIQRFAEKARRHNNVKLIDSFGDQRINAESVLGCLATIDWKDVWVESADDIYQDIKEFVI